MKNLYSPGTQFLIGNFHRAVSWFLFTAVAIFILTTQARAQITGITGTTIICPGSTTTLTATGSGPFTWYDMSTGGTLLHTGAAFTTPALSVNTTYWVSPNGGSRVAVNVNAQAPVITAVATPSGICPGSSSTLTVSPGLTASWYTAATGGTLLGTGALSVNPQSTTVYYAQPEGQGTATFNYTGNVQTFTVPAGVTSLQVDASGGAGGNSFNGFGGRVQATINVTPGAVLYIYVGQQGRTKYSDGNAFNGGGATDKYSLAGGGGGATDIRIGGQALTNRVLVAGGGGGGGQFNDIINTNMNGGNGGGLTGANGTATASYVPGSGGIGGSQTTGGASQPGVPNSGSGTSGSGGGGGGTVYTVDYCTNCVLTDVGGGGGGGGYYGGSGGVASGGGGGSSYTDYTQCQNVVHTQGYNNGNGTLTFTYFTSSLCNAGLTIADTVTVNPVLTSAVSVTASVCTLCGITFTANVTNGGTTPAYAWYKNNIPVGTNAPTYSDNSLNTGDNVQCTVTSSASCLVNNPVVANLVVAPPAITSFSPSAGPVGTLVTIQGSNLLALTGLMIAGASAIPVSNNGSQLVVMVMPGATTGGISLNTPFGATSGVGNFTVTPGSPPSLQQGNKLVGSDAAGQAYQGTSVSLSADGNTAIVGGYGDNNYQGAAWIYTRIGNTWTQQGNKLVGTGNSGVAFQGSSVSLSADGNTAIVGGYAYNNYQGATWIFTRNGNTWTQQGDILVGTGFAGAASQGYSVSLSANGNTAIVGGSGDNNNAGAAWVFTRLGGVWTQQGNKLVGTGNSGAAGQGWSVSLSADGNTAIVGGDADNNNQGAAWVFTSNGTTWTQQGNKLVGTGGNGDQQLQGASVSLSADGNTAIIGGFGDNNSQGAAWIYTRSGNTWTQQGNKLADADNTNYEELGYSVSLSADGNTAIVGGYGDNNTQGASLIYTRSGGGWTQRNKLIGTGNNGAAQQGSSVSLSADGNTAMAGGYADNNTQGAAWVFTASNNAYLSGLAISAGTLTPVFNPATINYTASVINGVSSIILTPTAGDPSATVKVNGTTVASGNASSPIALAVGANTIALVVTAPDGVTTQTYTVVVTRAPSSIASLAFMEVMNVSLSPSFSEDTLNYTGTVANSVTSTAVTISLLDSTASATVNGSPLANKITSAAIPLAVGANSITVLVTAQDGVTTTTYTIAVTRAAYPAALTALAVSTGTYSPAFAQATLNYTETIPYTTSQIAITPTTAYPAAKVTVNGTAVASGTASGLITLPVGANTINVVVTASDGVTQQTYTLVVTRLPSTNATLSAITLNHGTLSPTFAAGTFNYTATVPYATTSVTLKPVAGNASATIKVNGTTVTSNTASGAIALNVGSNVITTIVTAQDGITMDTYTVTITRLPVSTNATLAGIVPNKGTLSPAFAAATNNYTVIETNGTTSVGITPTAADPTATITVNGTAVASGVSSAAIALSVGSNTITILVTAQDGVTKDTYTLNVIRPSTNAKLSNLVLSSGTLSPVFATATTAYTASVANSVTSVTLTPTVAAAGATVLINGTAVASGSPSAAIALSVGSNTITTLVTAQDGVTTFTYTVTVTRAKSSNANLANITLNKGTLSPAFARATTSYTDMVTNGIVAVTLTPTVQDNTATLTVNGTPVASGSASGSLALVVGSNIETVVVTAQDGVTMQTYTVNVIRPSTNAKLSLLKLSSGTLTPAFNTNTVSYTASVPYTTSSIMVTPTVAVTGATVKVNGTTVTSGTPSAAVALSVGGNTITTVVTAQDGTTTDTYTVVVTRANPSTNNNLSNLTISKGTLTPAFAAATTGYSDMVTNSTASVTVTPTLADATATLTVNGTAVKSGSASGAISLAVGSNTINIVVSAQSGATQTYTVTVIRPSTNAKLANLTTNAGAVTPVFNPAATSYTLSVSNATASITVTPTVAVTGSTVAVNGAAVTSGSPSGAIALNVGSNTITTIVTAQDGVTTNTYTLTVTRATGSANIPDAAIGVNVGVQNFEPLLEDDGVTIHQGVSPNGDGINDFLQIDNISNYPDNNLKIMNRNGMLVYEAKGYDNATKVFDGHSNKTGQMQLPGTYFYELDYTVKGIIKHKTGFLVLKY